MVRCYCFIYPTWMPSSLESTPFSLTLFSSELNFLTKNNQKIYDMYIYTCLKKKSLKADGIGSGLMSVDVVRSASRFVPTIENSDILNTD